MSSQPVQIRPYAKTTARPEFVRLANRIAGMRRPMRFQWNGQTAEFSFSNLKLAPRGSWALDVVLGGHDLRVELCRLPDVAWISPALAGVKIQELPPELACALIESCLGEIFDALSKSGVDVRITSVAPFSHRTAPEEAIEWQVGRGGEEGWMRGHVAGGDAALEHLASLMQNVTITEDAGSDKLPTPVSLLAGRTRVPLADLQNLERHDVLLADLSAFTRARHCQLWTGGQVVAEGLLEGRAFTVQKLNRPEPTTMAAAAASTTPLNDLEIDVTFVVGQATLTLGELRSLAPGFVLDLPTPLGGGVTIFSNGRNIGTGEVIEVGDHLGVRITSLSASAS
ncbi:MAG: type III secretion system cytoplasmic ring protein SctQ [Prosthecobacter sp.]